MMQIIAGSSNFEPYKARSTLPTAIRRISLKAMNVISQVEPLAL
jgi:hypothetical protein